MRRFAAFALGLAVITLTSCEDATQPDLLEPDLSVSSQTAPDRFIVLFGASVADPAAAASSLASAHGLQIRHVYQSAVRGFSGHIPAARVDAVRRDARVQLVEPVRVERIVQQQVPTGIDRIEADRNPAADIDGTDDVRVDLDIAIIDTGIDQDHADLNVAGGQNFANGGPENWDDGNGHGTHVAGTTAAIDNGSGVVGVAPGARVWAARVCGNSGFCFTDDMVGGIDWVAGKKADFKAGVSGGVDFASANFSISTADDSSPCDASSGAVHQAICGLVAEGVVFGMAAGNDGRLKEAFPEAMAVSALADFDGIGGGLGSPTCRTDEDDTLANFSNYGPSVDIAAPGVCILSTWNDGGVNTISGTSMAAPHATGAVALYLHANGLAPATDGAGVDAIEDAIIQAAHAQSDPCGYTNEHAAEGSTEPLLFVNATAFGGDGSCDDGSGGDDGGTTNSPPVASFEYVCSDLSCDFDGTTSSDSDGTIESYAWDFGDGATGTGSLVSHTYSTDGTYTVVLTVTDDGGATDSESKNVTVGSTSTGISLSASGRKVQGRHVVDLTWSGASGDFVDIFRSDNGGAFQLIFDDTPNDGAETDNIGNRGSATYTYKLCETADPTVCSNEATVTF